MRNNIFVALLGLISLATVACGELPSGVDTEHGYRVVNHTNNAGNKVQAGDIIAVHVATFVGDTMMNDTRKMAPEPREIEIPAMDQLPQGRKVPALFDAVLLMAEGDSVTIYQAVDSLIERQLPKKYKSEKYVRYEVKLSKVKSKADLEKEAAAAQAMFGSVQSKMTTLIADYKAGKLNSNLVTLPSGLKVLVEEKGSGAPVKQGEMVKTQYYGALNNGTMFDNSFQRGEPLSFMVAKGQMIPGYDEGVQQLNHGGKAVFFLPPALGYGDAGTPDGSIPAKSELIFYVEVL